MTMSYWVGVGGEGMRRPGSTEGETVCRWLEIVRDVPDGRLFTTSYTNCNRATTCEWRMLTHSYESVKLTSWITSGDKTRQGVMKGLDGVRVLNAAPGRR